MFESLKNIFNKAKEVFKSIRLPNIPLPEVRFPDLSKYKLPKGKQNADWDFEGNPVFKEDGKKLDKDSNYDMNSEKKKD